MKMSASPVSSSPSLLPPPISSPAPTASSSFCSFPHNHLTRPYVPRDFTARPMESEVTAESQGSHNALSSTDAPRDDPDWATDQKKSLTTAQPTMTSHHKKYFMTGWCPSVRPATDAFGYPHGELSQSVQPERKTGSN